MEEVKERIDDERRRRHKSTFYTTSPFLTELHCLEVSSLWIPSAWRLALAHTYHRLLPRNPPTRTDWTGHFIRMDRMYKQDSSPFGLVVLDGHARGIDRSIIPF